MFFYIPISKSADPSGRRRDVSGERRDEHGRWTLSGDHVKAMKTTKQRYCDAGSGSWSRDRQEMHSSIKERVRRESGFPDMTDVYRSHDHSKPVALFLVGSPGAGKSTYKKERVHPHHRFVDIDCDAIKSMLPEYDPKNPMLVHDESVEVAKGLLGDCVSGRDSFTYDSTGLDVTTIASAIKQAKDKGFHIAVHYVKAPLEVCLHRNAKRERSVPESIVASKHRDVGWGAEQLRGMADHYVEHENVSPGESEEALAWMAGRGSDGGGRRERKVPEAAHRMEGHRYRGEFQDHGHYPGRGVRGRDNRPTGQNGSPPA